ncbi:hypothetical protein [Mesorhizobium sp. M0488]|uniref:hypothetical protein n=1 Tax=unclassified Mesorhizobium TaxID=325217 RepID=UPI003336AE96
MLHIGNQVVHMGIFDDHKTVAHRPNSSSAKRSGKKISGSIMGLQTKASSRFLALLLAGSRATAAMAAWEAVSSRLA